MVVSMIHKQSWLFVASAGLATLSFSCNLHRARGDGERQKLIALSRDSNAALMQGDIERYRALLEFSDDFTLMSPFGGRPSHGGLTEERFASLGKFFKNGSFQQDLVQAYETEDMVVLALIERTNAEVGGLPAQDWALRVTLVYRRDGESWRLVHRHADPLVHGVSLPYAAKLARGERPDGI
jgi:ketosteroid isomerase-like protein